MRKSKFFRKIGMLLAIASLSTFLLVGCQNSSSSNRASSNTRKYNASQRKQKYEEKLNGLVSKGTINQTQSDKILTALTERQQGSRPQNSGNGQNKENQSNSKQNRQNFNPLNKLVQDGTITQDQATTVWQALRGNFNKNTSNTQ